MSNTRPTVLIIDGNSFLHRSFHALPAFTNKDGFPTSAITGTLNMISSLQRKYSPEKLVVCFDAKGKTFRHEMYPEYKGLRPPSNPDLAVQFEPVKEIVAAWGLPMLSISGVESDDTMGTVAVKAVEEGFDVIISTSDKDMRQLVNERVKIVDTKDGDSKLPYGPEGVVQRMGVKPELVCDLLALTGDKVDGIPGVYDVGEGTAAKWLDEYGSFENVLNNAENIKGKRGEYLREALPHLPLSYKLVTIDTDVPLPCTIKELTGVRDEEKLYELVMKYELTQFKKDVGVIDPNAKSIESEIVVCNKSESASVAERIADPSTTLLIIDNSDTELDRVCLSINTPDVVYVMPFSSILGAIKKCYEEGHMPTLVGNNIKRVVVKLIMEGALPPYPELTVKDTRLFFYAKFGGRSKQVTISALNNTFVQMSTSSLRDVYALDEKTPKWSKLSSPQWNEVKAEELKLAFTIYEHVSMSSGFFSAVELETLHGEEEMLPILATMEATGAHIDKERLNALEVELKEKSDAIEKTILDGTNLESINFQSPKQVAHLLFDVKEIPVKKRSTSEKVLSKLAEEYPIVENIMLHRSLNTIRSRYIEGLLSRVHEDGKVHPQFNQGLALTGRLSAEDPNIQSIPVRSENGRKVREAFYHPDENMVVVAADYSQIELRVLAHRSGDEALIAAFNSGKDIHRTTASEILGIPYEEVSEDERRVAKAINFGLIYGMGAKRLASEADIPLKDAKRYMEAYFARYPTILQYLDDQLAFAKENMYVETITGRKVFTPNVNATNPMSRVHAELSAKNSGIQGSAADIVKKAMLDIAQSGILGDYVEIVMQVHDELVFYVSKDVEEQVKGKIVSIMENAYSLAVPLVVDIKSGKNWREAH